MEPSCRSRRSNRQIHADRLAHETVGRLGGRIRDARRRRRITQAQLGDLVDLSQSEISRLELGDGHGAPIATWLALAAVLDLAPRFDLARDPQAEPIDAGHLDVQELLLRLALATGRPGRFELPVGRGDPGLSVDVFVRDDRNRQLIVEEAWNSIRDIGAGARSFQRELVLASELAIAIGGERSYEVRGVWVVRATRHNRALVAPYPEALARFLPGSSLGWVRALTAGYPPPGDSGLVWCDAAATRLFASRRSGTARQTTTTPARFSSGFG